jgi:cytochrome b561
MYSTLLALHSMVRWFVLASLMLAIFRAYHGWLSEKPFSRLDNSIRHWTATIIHIQLLLGIWIYLISPIVSYFLSNFPESVHNREPRFFGMEHSIVMLTAVIVITIGSAKTKRKQSDNQKFKTMAIWFTLGLLLVLSSVPWPFSPFTSRPGFRSF